MTQVRSIVRLRRSGSPSQRTGGWVGRGRPPAPTDSAPVHFAVEAAGRAGGDDLTPCPSVSSTIPEFLL